jgi:hypothetical protein
MKNTILVLLCAFSSLATAQATGDKCAYLNETSDPAMLNLLKGGKYTLAETTSGKEYCVLSDLVTNLGGKVDLDNKTACEGASQSQIENPVAYIQASGKVICANAIEVSGLSDFKPIAQDAK